MEAVKRERTGARLPKGVLALSRIGEEIERRWSSRDYGHKFFPRIAVDCLREAAFHRKFDEDEIIAWVNRAKTLPQQLDPRGAFGQPPTASVRCPHSTQ